MEYTNTKKKDEIICVNNGIWKKQWIINQWGGQTRDQWETNVESEIGDSLILVVEDDDDYDYEVLRPVYTLK
jgi:hypothetical protein